LPQRVAPLQLPTELSGDIVESTDGREHAQIRFTEFRNSFSQIGNGRERIQVSAHNNLFSYLLPQAANVSQSQPQDDFSFVSL
jgi:hypothetical protein